MFTEDRGLNRLSPEAPDILFSHSGPSRHSLRLLQETSYGQTLVAAVGSTRAGLPPLRLSKPGAHGLAADLATGGPTRPPGIKIAQDPENQIRHVGAYRADATTQGCHMTQQNVFPLFD